MTQTLSCRAVRIYWPDPSPPVPSLYAGPPAPVIAEYQDGPVGPPTPAAEAAAALQLIDRVGAQSGRKLG